MFQKKQSSTAPIFHIIHPNRNEARVSHAHLHFVAKLALIPGLALIGRHLSRDYGDADVFL
ncbi:MAG: hypothetical protein DMG57_27135 [Acidobacteria bacterium]|nr:MAG: hypothetical protein DMG57_27135 [Acidobacteriota bacterium]